MKTMLRAAVLLGLLAIPTLADEPPKRIEVTPQNDMAKVEAVLFTGLKDVINQGVDLYNGGDIPGCYRLFQGTLLTLKPLLEHRKDLLKVIDGKLDEAEKEAVSWRKAFHLRAALDKVRSEIKPKGAGPDKVGVPPPIPDDEKKFLPAKKPGTPDDKKPTVPDDKKPVPPDDKKKLDDKKKIEDDKKKADDDELKKKKEEEEKKKDKDAPTLLKQPKELVE
jgi:hypothetical protein